MFTVNPKRLSVYRHPLDKVAFNAAAANLRNIESFELFDDDLIATVSASQPIRKFDSFKFEYFDKDATKGVPIKRIVSYCGANNMLHKSHSIGGMLMRLEADLYFLQDFKVHSLQPLGLNHFHGVQLKLFNKLFSGDASITPPPLLQLGRKMNCCQTFQVINPDNVSIIDEYPICMYNTVDFYRLQQYPPLPPDDDDKPHVTPTKYHIFQYQSNVNDWGKVRQIYSLVPDDETTAALTIVSHHSLYAIIVLKPFKNNVIFGCIINGNFYFTCKGHTNAHNCAYIFDRILQFMNGRTNWILFAFFPRTNEIYKVEQDIIKLVERRNAKFEMETNIKVGDIVIVQQDGALLDDYNFVIRPNTLAMAATKHVNPSFHLMNVQRHNPFLYSTYIPIEINANVFSKNLNVYSLDVQDIGNNFVTIQNTFHAKMLDDPTYLVAFQHTGFLLQPCVTQHLCNIEYVIDATYANVPYDLKFSVLQKIRYITLCIQDRRVTFMMHEQMASTIEKVIVITTKGHGIVLGLRIRTIGTVFTFSTQPHYLQNTLRSLEKVFGHESWCIFGNFGRGPRVLESLVSPSLYVLSQEGPTHKLGNNSQYMVVNDRFRHEYYYIGLKRLLFPHTNVPTCITISDQKDDLSTMAAAASAMKHVPPPPHVWRIRQYRETDV